MTKKKIRFSIVVWILAVVMVLSVICAAFTTSYSTDSSGNLSAGTATDTFSPFIDKDKAIADLRKDMIKSINKDLIKNIADYRLSGKVNAIITFSENSLVNEYNEKHSGSTTLEDYLQSSSAKSLAKSMTERQNKAADKLVKAGLVSAVKYGYTAIADGVYVTTTYENLNAIMQFDEVSRIIVSNTYLPAVATENPVNVYDTGIFNSSDVDYTGKGTIVAVLDTGCDYTHTAFTTHKVEQPLYDRNDIARILPQTVAYGYDNTVEPREVYYGNITNNKIAWGYDYADKDPDVMPFSSEHGTHVAGIIGGKDDVITGVAVDAQLAIMKVFSDYKDGADDGDILAALEDCVKLGVDAINMSLGTSCGFTREVDEVRKNEIYDSIEEAGISLVVAASNDYSSAYGSEFGNTNKTRNPDSATVGAPSTYNAAMSVASINGNKDKYMLANGNQEVFFLESFNQSAKEYNFFEMMGITEGVTKTFDYVTVPGYGYAANYIGTDVKGKIALVKRGDISFEEKARFAAENGAVACIIYNNVFGDIIMTVGNDITIPVVSIGKDDGDILAAVNKGKENEGVGTLEFSYSNQAGPFMSDFSSWGPNPDLSLKPEITAHGGNIYSAVPGGGYDKLSGTSMACPNMCGITVLIRQYVKENFPSLTTCEVRDLVNQLCMSTATIALDRKGNPYSPRKQGAGIADILKATTTDAYLYVDGMGKTKLELGDDPQRNGVYTMSVNLKNISDKSVSYTIGNLAMTESVSSSDKDYVAEMAYMLDVSADYNVKGGTLNGGVVTVPAGQTATVTATITLSGADKRYINGNFENGMYVEGFLTFTNTDGEGVSLNAPFLAFYGDWADAPIFDEDYYMVETEAHNGAIDEEDKIKADYYATTPLGKYYYDYIIPLGSYLYDMSPADGAAYLTDIALNSAERFDKPANPVKEGYDFVCWTLNGEEYRWTKADTTETYYGTMPGGTNTLVAVWELNHENRVALKEELTAAMTAYAREKGVEVPLNDMDKPATDTEAKIRKIYADVIEIIDYKAAVLDEVNAYAQRFNITLTASETFALRDAKDKAAADEQKALLKSLVDIRALAAVKADAKAAIEAAATENGVEAPDVNAQIDEAATIDEVNEIKAAALAEIALNKAKADAKAELSAYAAEKKVTAPASLAEAIDKAATKQAVAEALTAGKAEIDRLAGSLTPDPDEDKEVTQAKAAITAAVNASGVKDALDKIAKAKAAIEELTAEQKAQLDLTAFNAKVAEVEAKVNGAKADLEGARKVANSVVFSVTAATAMLAFAAWIAKRRTF